MNFSSATTFTLNPDILFVEKDSLIHLTFSSLESDILCIKHFAKEVFMMAKNNFDYDEMQSVASTFGKDIPNIHATMDTFLNSLVEKKIFFVNE